MPQFASHLDLSVFCATAIHIDMCLKEKPVMLQQSVASLVEDPTVKLGPPDTLLTCRWFSMTGTNEWLTLIPRIETDPENLFCNVLPLFVTLSLLSRMK